MCLFCIINILTAVAQKIKTKTNSLHSEKLTSFIAPTDMWLFINVIICFINLVDHFFIIKIRVNCYLWTKYRERPIWRQFGDTRIWKILFRLLISWEIAIIQILYNTMRYIIFFCGSQQGWIFSRCHKCIAPHNKCVTHARKKRYLTR